MAIGPLYCLLSVIGAGVLGGLLVISWITIIVVIIFTRRYYNKDVTDKIKKVDNPCEEEEEQIELTVDLEKNAMSKQEVSEEILVGRLPWIAKLFGIPDVECIIKERDKLQGILCDKEQLDSDRKQYLIDKALLDEEKEKHEKEIEKFSIHKEKYIKEEINKTKSIDISKQEYSKSIAYLRKTKESLEEEEKKLTEEIRKLNNRKTQLATEVRTITKEKQRLTGDVREIKRKKPEDVDRTWLNKQTAGNKNERLREVKSAEVKRPPQVPEVRRQSWQSSASESRKQWQTEKASVFKRKLSDMPLEANSTQNLTG